MNATVLCPRGSLTSFAFTPAASRCLAWVWRRSWKRIRGTSRVFDQPGERPTDGVRVRRRAVGLGEYEVTFGVVSATHEHPRFELGHPVGALDPDSLGIEVDAAAAPLGLDDSLEAVLLNGVQQRCAGDREPHPPHVARLVLGDQASLNNDWSVGSAPHQRSQNLAIGTVGVVECVHNDLGIFDQPTLPADHQRASRTARRWTRTEGNLVAVLAKRPLQPILDRWLAAFNENTTDGWGASPGLGANVPMCVD